jgi:hypothetical protein
MNYIRVTIDGVGEHLERSRACSAAGSRIG